jgi:hypothetical protein
MLIKQSKSDIVRNKQEAQQFLTGIVKTPID